MRTCAGCSCVKLQRAASMVERTSWLTVATHFGSLGASLQLTRVIWSISIIFVCSDTFLRLVNTHLAVYWTKLGNLLICTILAMFFLGFVCHVCVASLNALMHPLRPCLTFHAESCLQRGECSDILFQQHFMIPTLLI